MLKLALPNGSLEKKTVALFETAGWTIKREGRAALAETDCPFVEQVFITRPQAIPRVIADGVCDIGICGMDCIVEEQSRPKEDAERSSVPWEWKFFLLPYSKETYGPTRITLCTREDNPVRSLQGMPPGSTVYSEYPNFTRSYLQGMRGIQDVRIIPSPGSTEGHVAIGQYDYGVCISETGRTQRENGLRVVATMYVSETVVIASSELEESEDQAAQKLICRLLEKA